MKCRIVNIRHICICVCLCVFNPNTTLSSVSVSLLLQQNPRPHRGSGDPLPFTPVLNIFLLFKPVLSDIGGSFHLCSLDSHVKEKRMNDGTDFTGEGGGWDHLRYITLASEEPFSSIFKVTMCIIAFLNHG